MAILPHDPVALASFLVLGGALALMLGGLALVIHSTVMTRQAIARRVDFVRGRPRTTRRMAPAPELRLARVAPRWLSEPEQRQAVRTFARFGVRPDFAVMAVLILRGVSAAALGVCAALALSFSSFAAKSAATVLLGAFVMAAMGWFIPLIVLRFSMRRHARAVVAGLPDALELLVICVEAGLAFEDGIIRVVGELRKSRPAVAEELNLTAADLAILPSREQALANLAARVEMPSVQTLTTTLLQTLRYGTPLAQALRVAASELRADALVRLEERANQLPTLMTIPMMLFILPTIFMIVAGPAALRLIDVFHL